MLELSKMDSQNPKKSKESVKMKMPKKLAEWCTVLFFLLFGVMSFWAFPFSGPIVGILALGAAVFTFLGM